MKKIFIFAMIAAGAATMSAQSLEWATTAEQTVKSFTSVAKANENQLISNQAGLLVEGVNFKLNKFQVECLTTAQDLQNGQEGALPKFAEVNKLMLKGSNLEANRNMSIEAYVENTDENQVRYLDLTYSEMPLPVEDYKVANMTPVTMPEQGQQGNIVELPFDIKPFYYQGNGVYITLSMLTPDEVKFNFNVTEAELETPAVYRNDYIPFYAGMSDENEFVPAAFANAFKALVAALDIKPNTLPAYELEYYTHDIIGNVTNPDGSPYEGATVVVTVGNDEYTAVSDSNGQFVIEGLDYTKPCMIAVTMNDETVDAVMSFENAENDINVNVVAPQVTAVQDINAGKAINSVCYYDMAGRMSNVPFNGMNVVVTKYVDGTTQVSKVVR